MGVCYEDLTAWLALLDGKAYMSQWFHGVHRQRRLDSKGGGSMECLVIPDSVVLEVVFAHHTI